MMRHALRRLVWTVPLLVGVATLVFAPIHLVPGDPVVAMPGEGAAPHEVAELAGARLSLLVGLVVVSLSAAIGTRSARSCSSDG